MLRLRRISCKKPGDRASRRGSPRDPRAYQQRPKRHFVGARTAEYRFAQYVDNWRLKIERIGNLNYPEEAKARKIYGSLQLTVAIKANGEVEDVRSTARRATGF